MNTSALHSEPDPWDTEVSAITDEQAEAILSEPVIPAPGEVLTEVKVSDDSEVPFDDYDPEEDFEADLTPIQKVNQGFMIHGVLSSNSYRLPEEGLTPEQFLHDLRTLAGAHKSIQFALGDAIALGDMHYQDIMNQYGDEIELETLRNYEWVARKIPVEMRSDKVAYSVFKELASDTIPLQGKKQIIDVAVQEAEAGTEKTVTVAAVKDVKRKIKKKDPVTTVTMNQKEEERLVAIARASKHLVNQLREDELQEYQISEEAKGFIATLISAIQEHEGKYGDLG